MLLKGALATLLINSALVQSFFSSKRVLAGVIVFFTAEGGLLGTEIGLEEGLNFGGTGPGLGEEGLDWESCFAFSKRDIVF